MLSVGLGLTCELLNLRRSLRPTVKHERETSHQGSPALPSRLRGGCDFPGLTGSAGTFCVVSTAVHFVGNVSTR